MKIPMYQVDAFASKQFGGNPAAVCILEKWLPDNIMQSIAAENNLAETAFVIKEGREYGLRWFTPTTEVDLCGHATLATSKIVFEFIEPDLQEVVYNTKSGKLYVTRDKDLLVMDFPAWQPRAITIPDNLAAALGSSPKEVYLSRDILAIYNSEEEIRAIKPDMKMLTAVKEGMGVIVSAKGQTADFVSRFFCPKEGIPEDPVTGSAHCTLIPFWAERLKKTKLHAIQLSERVGELFCEQMNGRVKISGRAFLFLKGEIYIEN